MLSICNPALLGQVITKIWLIDQKIFAFLQYGWKYRTKISAKVYFLEKGKKSEEMLIVPPKLKYWQAKIIIIK